MRDELDGQRLLDALGDSMLADPAEAAFGDPALAAWLARDAAARQTNAERARTAELAVEFAHRFRMARAAERFASLRPRTLLRETAAPIYGTPAAVLSAAAEIGHAIVLEPRAAAGAGCDWWDAPVETWLELPPELPPGSYVAFPVQGESMRPVIKDGDHVLVRIGTDIAVDDVIVARADDGYVVKHVSALTASQVELSSFNVEQPSFRIPREAQRIVGKVVMRVTTVV